MSHIEVSDNGRTLGISITPALEAEIEAVFRESAGDGGLRKLMLNDLFARVKKGELK